MAAFLHSHPQAISRLPIFVSVNPKEFASNLKQPTTCNKLKKQTVHGVSALSLRNISDTRLPIGGGKGHENEIEIANGTAMDGKLQESESLMEHPGGKLVVELVAAWNNLTDRLSSISSRKSELLLRALKISVPLLQNLSPAMDGRPRLSKALCVACILADLQVDAEVIAVGLLKEPYEMGAIGRKEINLKFGHGISHLLHECLRVKNTPRRLDVLDDQNAYALRKYCLAYHDIRAVIVDLASKLDLIRQSRNLPRYHQQTLALDVLQVYAPLAHAIGAGQLSLELEDHAFQLLFPKSYSSVDEWLSRYEKHGKATLEKYGSQILEVLEKDKDLNKTVDIIAVETRYKSRFSTMKKLLKDGRKLDEVYDILGIRIILKPISGDTQEHRGVEACYKAYELIQQIYEEVPERKKDYISNPKENGYSSLHLAIRICDDYVKCPFLEVQIRTTEMDAIAAGGTASHALYKGEVTNPEEVRQLKEVMMAAANLAAFHFHDIAKSKKSPLHSEMRSQMFKLFDKNKDGFISMEELKDMMEELGANKEDANELMQLVDANSDGSLSADEFSEFQKRLDFFQKVDGIDQHCSKQIGQEFQKLNE